MTFSARETSLFGGEPQRAVIFRRGNLAWRYADGDRAMVIDGQNFEAPGGITISPIRDSSQRAKNRVTIELPIDLSVADNWLPFPTHGRVLVAVLALHRGEAEYNIEWTGRVVGPDFGDTTMKLVCEPSQSVTKNRGNNLRWQRGCPLAFYSQGVGMCNADPEDHKTEGEVITIDGTLISVAEFAALPTARLAGGFLSWVRPDGEVDYRTIMAHEDSMIEVDYATDAIEEGVTTVAAFDGCRHDWQDCTNHDNTDNYGGCRYIPVKSPNDGNPVQ